MSSRSREEAIRLGFKVYPVKHRMTRRAPWHEYWRAGVYGITLHLHEDEKGGVERCMLLSRVVGNLADPRSRTNVNGKAAINQDSKGTMSPYGMASMNQYCKGAMSPDGMAVVNQYCKGGMSPDGMAAMPQDCKGPMSPYGMAAINQDCKAVMNAGGGAAMTPGSLGAYVELTEVGRLVDQKVREMGTHVREEGISVGAYVLMPTHIHLTIVVAKDLPMHVYRGKERRWTLGDVMCGFEKGCTSWWWRYLEGECVEEILANPTRRRESSSPPSLEEPNGTMRPAPSLWHVDSYNDKILTTQERQEHWIHYVHNNPYYWRLRDLYPMLFEHRLHLMAGGADYTAYGCMWLLERDGKVQVKCHRLARRSMLTDREWQLATQSMQVIRAYEANAREKRLGHFDWDWYRSTQPDAITPIDYTRTEAFRRQKSELLSLCEEEDAVLVSPAISAGEKDIFYSALEKGHPCIRLVKDPIPEKGHANDKEREYCSCGQLLVLGPWEVKLSPISDGSIRCGLGNETSSASNFMASKYAKFHNLNEMASELCMGIREVEIDVQELEKCR